MSDMPAALLRIATVLFAFTGLLLAQGTGTHTTKPDTDGGHNEIHLDTGTANDVEIKEVRIWVEMSQEWRKIKPECITPNPGGDNVIRLPANTNPGDKFQIDWKTTTSDGNPIEDEDFKSNDKGCADSEPDPDAGG